MKPIDYEKTLLSLYQLSFQDLRPLIHETDDDFLARKIYNFLFAVEVKKGSKTSHKQYTELVNYLEHAIDTIQSDFNEFEDLEGFI